MSLAGRRCLLPAAALGLVFSLSLASGAAAQSDEDSSAPEGAEVASADAAEEWDAGERVRELMAEWKATDPIAQQLLARDDIAVVDGEARAPLRTDQERWGKVRSLTYTEAFSEAMKEYVLRIRATHTNRLLRKHFEEDIDESELIYRPGVSAEDIVSRVAIKAATLTERKLDQALVESGMNPSEIARLTPPQKKVTFSKRIVVEATTKAVGSAAGLVPIKTFEAFDDEGNSAIGVVAVRSPRMRNLASQLSGRRTIRPDEDRVRIPISDQIGALSDEELINEFGPRVWWDEHGYPTIVAFGQWAWSPEGLDKREKARQRAFAIEQAEGDASFHLSMFANASARFDELEQKGTETEKFYLLSPDGSVSEEETVKVIDKMWQDAQVDSALTLTGLEVQREWFSPHPDVEGHELVGVVVSWSPAQEDRIRAELGKKPKHKPVEKTVRKSSVSSGTSESRDLMDPADF